jgi:hypothetical protein
MQPALALTQLHRCQYAADAPPLSELILPQCTLAPEDTPRRQLRHPRQQHPHPQPVMTNGMLQTCSSHSQHGSVNGCPVAARRPCSNHTDWQNNRRKCSHSSTWAPSPGDQASSSSWPATSTRAVNGGGLPALMLAHSPLSHPTAGATTGHSTKMCEYVSRSGAAEQQAAWHAQRSAKCSLLAASTHATADEPQRSEPCSKAQPKNLSGLSKRAIRRPSYARRHRGRASEGGPCRASSGSAESSNRPNLATPTFLKLQHQAALAARAGNTSSLLSSMLMHLPLRVTSAHHVTWVATLIQLTGPTGPAAKA